LGLYRTCTPHIVTEEIARNQLRKSRDRRRFIPQNFVFQQTLPALRLLDLSETQADLDSVQEVLKEMTQELDFDLLTEDPPQGVARILVGKRASRNHELERRERAVVAATSSSADD